MPRALADSDVRHSTAKGARFEVVQLEPEHMRELMVNKELDALGIRYAADVQATWQQNQAAIDVQQASRQRANASAAVTSGYLGAAGSLLQTGGNYLRDKSLPLNTPAWFGT
jgi:hypothetical protein